MSVQPHLSTDLLLLKCLLHGTTTTTTGKLQRVMDAATLPTRGSLITVWRMHAWCHDIQWLNVSDRIYKFMCLHHNICLSSVGQPAPYQDRDISSLQPVAAVLADNLWKMFSSFALLLPLGTFSLIHSKTQLYHNPVFRNTVRHFTSLVTNTFSSLEVTPWS